jgi:PKD repeat protein
MKFLTRTLAATAAVAMVASSSCTLQSQDVPSLTGPSELALSLTITASPDVLSQDGGSQSLITIVARDPNGQPISGLGLRLQTQVDGQEVDYGSLTAKSLVTNNQGTATAIYTAPPPPPATATSDSVVTIAVTPVGSNYDNSLTRGIGIRLARPGVILPPNGTPTASFFFAPTAPSVGTEVLFDASGSSDDGRIVSYQWNWGDGDAESTSKATIQKDYEAAGTYTVRLTVTDDNGLSASSDQTITVGAPSTPTASFVFSPADPAINQDIHFDATASAAPVGESIVRYEWIFGDGTQTSTSARTVTKSGGYTVAGSYLVTLKVTDSAGQIGIATETVDVSTTLEDGPTAVFTFSPTDPHPNTEITFDAKDSIAPEGRTIVSYEWNFGDTPEEDVVQDEGRIVAHTYDEVFTYTVTLTVTDSDGRTDTASQTVNVSGLPEAVFTFSPTDPEPGDAVQFNGSESTAPEGQTIVSYRWNFGDGSAEQSGSSLRLVSHTFAAERNYVVTLTVTDSAGNSHTSSQTVAVGPS